MTTETHQRLVEYIHDQADEAVRGIVRDQDGTLDLLFRREDIDMETFEDRVALTTKLAWAKYHHIDDERTVGETQTHIELFDNVAVVHLREGPNDGVMFAIEVPAAGKLAEFVEGCHTVLALEGDAQQSVASGH